MVHRRRRDRGLSPRYWQKLGPGIPVGRARRSACAWLVAARGDVLRLVVGQGVTLAALGVVIGIVAALGVKQFIKTLLYNVTASDPLSFSIVAMFLSLVAIVASYVPARRAMGVDPIIALRND